MTEIKALGGAWHGAESLTNIFQKILKRRILYLAVFSGPTRHIIDSQRLIHFVLLETLSFKKHLPSAYTKPFIKNEQDTFLPCTVSREQCCALSREGVWLEAPLSPWRQLPFSWGPPKKRKKVEAGGWDGEAGGFLKPPISYCAFFYLVLFSTFMPITYTTEHSVLEEMNLVTIKGNLSKLKRKTQIKG